MSDPNDRTMMKARQHVTVIAASLRHVIGVEAAAALLIGNACGVLSEAYSPERTAAHLREIADSIENDDGDADQAAPEGRLQ